jgi:hypothetical protein
MMIKIYDKGNWKVFIGYKDWKVYDLIKCSWRMYFLKYSFEHWLIPYGNPLKEWKDFYFGKD